MQDVHPVGGGGFVGESVGGRVFGDRRLRPHSHHHQAVLKCPRCDSLNTKFCYYNNYNLSQPRHFCKNCRRYWTKGGVLRNIPVGGGCRKAKRSSSSSLSKSKSSTSPSVSLSSNKTSNSHSSSTESSTTTTITTTTAVAHTTVGGSHSVIQNFESENNRMDMGLEPLMQTNQELLFPSTEIGGFMNLMSNSAADPLCLGGCDAATTASFSQFLQNQAAVQDWEVRTTGGAHQEDVKMHGLVGGVLDPTIRIDDYRGSNNGLPALDWQAASYHGQGLFDLPSNVDNQAYWSQTTTSHHHLWSDHANNDQTLFLP